ncbi:uncharacterized protein LOC115707993 isoform X1 [Cannabis sativa]|uniref:uncharacterized protein LOC115707993 isoform X1 n=1 Tax=Cannabis sativa TaxID=3483 RepID=UPI0029CA4F79|nr:uncharacterized protein LOC115707993 isoform X1 [Cannabis sativa]
MESSSQAESMILLEDFGQKVDLTRRIREVLVNYPEGTTVLKELIQNADDAGATKVCLCLDRRVHGSGSLLSQSLSQWQGPSLLAYNDAVFTEDDFVSISRIGGSTKHSQAWKTGRFGVGFNSVYHLTDLPSFVSGNYVVLFDPQGIYLPNVSASNPGKRIDFVNSSAISVYRDQFFPYCAFGCDMTSPFPGTLFRFPLRNADQAVGSKLSRQAYLEDDISSMFLQLYEEGVFALLFLKSVLSVEMYVWDANEPHPRKLYSCCVTPANHDIVWHRQTVLRLSKSINSTDTEMDCYSLNFVREAATGNLTEKKVDSFYIVQTMASATSRIGSFAATASKEYDIHLLPWASVAACTSDSSSQDDDSLRIGRAFCFLPLPVRTGLSVQVNGYFEVASNRRGIWYGEDMDRGGKIRSVWNRLLLEDVVAPSFRQLLLGVQGLLDSKQMYYSLWPSGSFEEPWNILVEKVYANISDAPVLYSDIGGGRWVSPIDAFLHDEEFSKSKELGDALMQLGMPIVRLPTSLFNMLLKCATTFQQKVVTPHTVRHFLRECKSLSTLSKSYKLVLLEYCLEDLVDIDVGRHASNLPLLPLANGDFGLFSEASKGFSYFICNELEYVLLQPIHDRVIDRNLPHNLMSRLSAIAKSLKANLCIFNVHYMLHFFPRFMPAEWKYKNKVSWDAQTCEHPTSAWVVLFWQYLKNHCEELSLFSDWPILPSISGHLYRTSKQSKMINAEKLMKKMRDILIKIGCKILSPDYGIDHSDLSDYVNDCNGVCILESIYDVVTSGGGVIPTFFNNFDAEERDELRGFLLDSKWYFSDSMNVSDIRNCKRLPIFKVHAVGSTPQFNFSDLESSQKYLPPTDIPEHFLGDDFIISTSSSEEEIFVRYFGIERMGKAHFYKKYVLNRILELESEVRDNVILSILQNLPQLCIEDVSFRDYLRSLEFVPTHSGTVKRPDMLYDPRNEELFALLEDSDSFPYGIFQESHILDMLQGLGLRTSVSHETIIHSARQVEHLMHKDQQQAYSRGKVLLSYLEVNAIKWIPDTMDGEQGKVNKMFSRAAYIFKPSNLKSNLEKFWNDLRLISWCPVLVHAPFQALPWPVVSSMVAPPKLVRLQTDLWLTSASMRILDGECSSTALSYCLGWSIPPGGSVIAAQLLELGKNNEIVNDQVLRQELALAMPRIYAILTNLIGSDEMEIVKAVLEGCRWIWVGDGFATADEVVLDGPLHLAPYIRVIPIDLAVFKELFSELGIRQSLKSIDFGDILCRMYVKKDSSPLDAHELRAAILIVQHLAEVPLHEQKVKIYLPDVSCRLFLAGDLVYNDAPWLLGSEDPDNLFNVKSTVALTAQKTIQKFVHGNISNDVAEKLGVCSLRRILLAESADSMNLSLSGAAEAFGQHEALTTRLKHILEMYADGPGILYELVQNAEDAGASEVSFLLDKTQYGTSSILSPEMADWQGPALYCFNNSVFTPQDLYAISRIGQESKLEKPFAIGRFGLGFNCVYHFTDIPTFVSGENIVMFDPHACHLPGISPSHPGLRIKFAGRKILEQFPDQFSPFLHFGCDLQHPFPGTLFRFPLRSANAAARSQIKKEGYAPEDVVSLFASFSQVVSDALLFLQNVKTVSVFVKEGSGHEMQLLHRVQKDCIRESQMESNSPHGMFSFLDGTHRSGIDKDQILQKLNKVTDKDLPYRCQKIIIKEEGSCGNLSHCWVTSECLGRGPTKNKSTHSNDRSNAFIPWASVAAYLHSVNVDSGHMSNNDLFQVPTDSIQDRKDFQGRAFCFLPLPMNTGLPAHVNAYFELSSNRRDIWFGNDMAGGGKKRSDWNLYLLEDVVAPAYGRMLEKIALDIGPSDLFFSFWPKTIGLQPWASVVRKLYVFIADLSLRVLYTEARGGQWISTKHAIFPDFMFNKAQELTEVLSDTGLPLVNVLKPIVEIFMEVCPSLHFLTPQLLRTLLIRKRREFKDRNAMILTLEYCLFDLKVPIQTTCLYGLPLLPLSDGSFTIFEKNGFGERIYIAQGEEYGLLKVSIPNQLVDNEIPEEVYGKLCDIARREDSNISFLSYHLLEKLLLKLLPAEWQHAKQVTWIPGAQGQPSLEWLRLLWDYLKSSHADLSLFSKWPLLPVGNNCLLQLVENSHVIRDDAWSENMASLLLKIGCLFLRSDLPIDHPQLENFVQPPTMTGILNAVFAIAGKLENIEELFRDASEAELHEFRSFILQSKWFLEGQVAKLHVDIIKHLPIFESYKSRKLVSLSNPIKWLKPYGVREDLLDDDFVRTDSEKENIILRKYLEIEEPTKVEFYKNHVLSCMSKFFLQSEVISVILHELKLLVEEDISVKSSFSTVAFVLAADGSWQQPSRLYDPRIPELQTVLHNKVYFPSEIFSDNVTLDTLVIFGLRRTLGFTGLLDCARSVSLFQDSRQSETSNYGRNLLVCMDALSLKLSNQKEGNFNESHDTNLNNNFTAEVDDIALVTSPKREKNNLIDNLNIDLLIGDTDDKPEEEFWSEMREIAWCPVCADPPIEGLPWLKSTCQIAPPTIVRPKSQMWMVSYSMHILDGECQSSYLQLRLGWTDQINIDVLFTQLIELSTFYGQLKLTSIPRAVVDAELQKGIPSLYMKMQEYVGTIEFNERKYALEGVCWVWIGDDFVSSDALAFDSPVKFSPYLYVVPSELSDFRNLLLELGVGLSFDVPDYLRVLQRLQSDVKGFPLSADQLSFVHCILDAVADCCLDQKLSEISSTPLLIPDFSGVLMNMSNLVYNDAPWMENNTPIGKRFVHPSVSNDLASRLGVQSLRCVSLVDEEMTKDLPCMDYARINELLALYGDNDLLFFDLLELADSCKAKKLHLIFDKREHPRQSLLQHNLGDFQGPALVAVLEGTVLSREEVSSLQFLPPWRLRGNTLNYGLGLLSSYFVCDLLSMVSGGYFYIFDPRGSAFSVPPSRSPAAKVFSLTGTNLVERFHDQFSPMLLDQNTLWSSSDSTIIRMPLSSDCLKDGLELGLRRIKQINDRFLEQGSRTLLFLKSVMQVSLLTWEEEGHMPCEDFSICIDPSSAIMRNPFSEKKWRKFQISRLFSSSNAAIKLNVLDVTTKQGDTSFIDQWLVVLTLGSGQTRNMALDRRYLAYNLAPIGGVAAHISRNGNPVDFCVMSSLMSPLSLSGGIKLPVTILGCFLVCHNGGRHLFKYQDREASAEAWTDAGNQLIEAWNTELMSCVRDSYVELILEILRLRRDHSSSAIESTGRTFSLLLKAYGDQIYNFWPRSYSHDLISQPADGNNLIPPQILKADWDCIIEQVIKPFYARAVDLPLWQLYSGNLVKAEEGMFLSQPGNGVGGNLLPATVCGFVKEHYPVFSVPWELVTEIQAVGTPIREVKPKMVRDLLRVSKTSIVLRSVDTYLDVLEYCLSDIQIGEASISNGNSSFYRADHVVGSTSASVTGTNNPNHPSTHNANSPGDAIEMVTSLGKALFDFGRGVVEDIGRTGGPSTHRRTDVVNGYNRYEYGDQNLILIANELKGVPCPTATNNLTKLGIAELWVGNQEQQILMKPLGARFMHPKVLDRSTLADIFSNGSMQTLLKLQNFSLQLLASHMKLVFHEKWVSHVMAPNIAPWFSWENTSSSGGEEGPSSEWIRLFWKNFTGSLDDLQLFSDWPIIPAFLGRPILCRVRERNLVFVPPALTNFGPVEGPLETNATENSVASDTESVQSYISAFEVAKNRYPWLLPLLNQCNIPIFDVAFLDCAAPCNCLPTSSQSLGQVIASKLVAAKDAGYFTELSSFASSSRDELLALFANDYWSNGSNYRREELEVLRSLSIYKTVVGSYTSLQGNDHCIVSSNSFLKPYDEQCLSYSRDSIEFSLLQALGVSELHDQQILLRFGLPGFENKPESEREDILIYLFTNWHEIQQDSSLVEALKETKFVRSADEFCMDLSKPKELFDLGDSLLTSVFSGERKRFPGERFSTDGWLHILRKVGLRTTADADVILECAKRMEFLGSECMKSDDLDDFDNSSGSQAEVSVEIWTLAGSVIETILSNFAVLYGNNFCNHLGKIACVPAEFGFPDVGGRKGGKRVLTSYSEAILSKDWPLAWSCAPILSKKTLVPPQYSWGSLQLRSPPAFSTVLKHLQVIGKNGGEDTLAHWPTASGMMTIDEASCEVLKYLDQIWGSLSSSDIKELEKVPFIPAANGTRLVIANLLFARLSINLSPFAFELPTPYLPFVKVLKDLGLQDTLSVASAKDLLLNLQNACGYQRLNPNELRAVFEILYFICDGADGSHWTSEAIVPDDGCRLVHAKSCVYIDSYGSRFVKSIETSRIRFIHPDLPERLCLVLGIKKLSDVVTEELVHEEHLQTLECIGSVTLLAIREKLLNRSFQGALWTVVNSMASYIPALNNVVLETIQNSLESVAGKLQFVKCLHTRFLLLPNSIEITRAANASIIPEWTAGTHDQRLYFVDRSKSRIVVAEPPAFLSVFDVIAIVVSQVLGSPTPLPIGPLFVCPGGSETAIVDILKLRSDKNEMEASGGRNSLIGKDLLPQDTLQVQFHPLRPFYAGEIVAWRSQNGEKLKYGRVPEDVRPSAGQALYRFKVETSPGETQPLLSSQVMSFRSTSMGSETTVMLPDESHRAHGVGHSEVPESSGRVQARSSQQRQLGNELQYGRVSAAELVQAVDEMLSAVGIHMDAEKQSLLQKTITLQEQLKDSETALLLEQEKADVAAKEADTAKAAWVCRVCLTAEVDMTMVPCGHVLCRRCSSAVSRCPFCRLQVSRTMRIYRP